VTQRLDVSFLVSWEGRWHVGSGHATAAADRLLQRRKNAGPGPGAPFVPGSQVKGVLRHACERLAVGLGFEAPSPHFSGDGRHLLPGFRPLRGSGLLIDRLFGSRYQGECLFVDDAVAEEAPARTALSSRTALDRLTGTAKEHTLFVSEVAEAGPPLRGRVRARHPKGVLTCDGDGFPYEYALLVAGLLSLDGLGGTKSAGLGRCRVEQIEMKRNGQPVTTEQALACFAEDDWKGMIELIREMQQA
jgi:CRISPR/Cas system CSM-associated protein Csm3 (group 7 of RAMP superfamily)